MKTKQIIGRIKNLDKKKKILIAVSLIVIIAVIIIVVGNIITSNNEPKAIGNRFQNNINAQSHSGTIKAIQNKIISFDENGKQVDFNVAARISIYNISNSSKDSVLQVKNTVTIRFSSIDNNLNKAITITKVNSEGASSITKNLNKSGIVPYDKNVILLNGNTDQQLYDVVGEVLETNGNSLTIKPRSGGARIIFDVNNAQYNVATSIPISSVNQQTQATLWSRKAASGLDAIFVVIKN